MKKYYEIQLRKQLLKYYSQEKLEYLLKLNNIEWRNIMPKQATIYEWELVNLIKLHKKSIEDARDDVNYYALLNDDKLVAYYEGRIVSLQLSLNQLRTLHSSLFYK